MEDVLFSHYHKYCKLFDVGTNETIKHGSSTSNSH